MRDSSAAALDALQQGSWRTSGPSRWLGWLPILGCLFRDSARRADVLTVMMLTGDNIASARSIAGLHDFLHLAANTWCTVKMQAGQVGIFFRGGCPQNLSILNGHAHRSNLGSCLVLCVMQVA